MDVIFQNEPELILRNHGIIGFLLKSLLELMRDLMQGSSLFCTGAKGQRENLSYHTHLLVATTCDAKGHEYDGSNNMASKLEPNLEDHKFIYLLKVMRTLSEKNCNVLENKELTILMEWFQINTAF
ncbi:hypothetical protein TNIN_377241 [Trichonephila inaurata madagascariensis]|uniref:Uncharacterized protein n=1 Tax=Trichonephila inaurata madagascariensis TaxID=2747483 RepID=A0A8X6X9Y8_9ARAC|nr:hypothetical protein TNIN_377241 [Trichonephila inaurata madagascariensis]